VTFLYFTGCRIGAALAITWTQIEFENGRCQLRIEGNQTKNEEPILLPLPLELNEILEKLPRKGICLIREISGSLFRLHALR
jgi:integrase